MEIIKPPVFLFAYANDMQHSLRLDQEERGVREALQTMEDTGRVQRVTLGGTILDDIYSNLIAITIGYISVSIF